MTPNVIRVRPGLAMSTNPSFFVVRVHEGVPRSPCALVSARPRPQAAAQDRRDTVARRRAPCRDGSARTLRCGSHVKRFLKLGRLRLRGPRGAQDEFVLGPIAQNLRFAALLARPPLAE